MAISVIVPVRNEEHSIRDLLDGLLHQSTPPVEIVITDGGSTDKTSAIINEYIDRGAPIRLIRSGPALPGRGRNLAAAQASGEWLGFIDAGVRPDKDWLEKLAKRTSGNSRVDVVYGNYDPVTDTLFKECAAIAYVPPPRLIGEAMTRPRSIASALVRKVVWETVGGFPEDLRSAEDLLFMERINARGFVVVYEPSARVKWNVQPTILGTFKRFKTYARNNVRAGLWRDWQTPIFKRYALLAILALPVFFFGLPWLSVPVFFWLLMLIGRAILSIWRNRICYPATAGRNLLRLFVLIPLIVVLDVALFAGTLEWFFKDKLRFAGSTLSAGHGA